MDEKPLVTILTPCYNGEKYLKRFFMSILNQTYDNLEVIFVNDGSNDKTELIAKQYGQLIIEKGYSFVYLTQQNAGQAAAINYGLKFVSGDYITWPDADDEMLRNCITEKVKFLEAHQEYAYCVCETECVNASTQDIIEILSPKKGKSQKELFEALLWGSGYFVSGAFMVRMSALDTSIKNREIYPGKGGQNAQLLLPVTWKGKIGYIDMPLYRYYIHADSHSHSALQNAEKTIEQLYLFEAILVNTLQLMEDPETKQYIPIVKAQKARLRFGHALDTKNKTIIRRCLRELCATRGVTVRDFWLYYRYTSKMLNHFRPVG